VIFPSRDRETERRNHEIENRRKIVAYLDPFVHSSYDLHIS